MVKRLLIAWACNIGAIFVASVFVDGIDYADDFWVLILAGLVFGLVNVLIKPILKLLALPVIVVTFGIVLFMINILMLYITSWIVGPFEISSFRAAAAGAAIIWGVNFVLDVAFGIAGRRERREREAG